jgi:hypothetical protein
VPLVDDIGRIAAGAAGYARPGEEVVAVLPIEPVAGERLYLCAFADAEGAETWLALADDGAAVTSRKRVRDAASIAALCEIAEESSGVAVGDEPRVASVSYLDSLGATAQNGNVAGVLQSALPAVKELTRDVESNYRLQLRD